MKWQGHSFIHRNQKDEMYAKKAHVSAGLPRRTVTYRGHLFAYSWLPDTFLRFDECCFCNASWLASISWRTMLRMTTEETICLNNQSWSVQSCVHCHCSLVTFTWHPFPVALPLSFAPVFTSSLHRPSPSHPSLHLFLSPSCTSSSRLPPLSRPNLHISLHPTCTSFLS